MEELGFGKKDFKEFNFKRLGKDKLIYLLTSSPNKVMVGKVKTSISDVVADMIGVENIQGSGYLAFWQV